MPPAERASPHLVLVGGHESAEGADLSPYLDALPGAVVTSPGRSLHNRVSALLSTGEQGAPVVVLPMTWGRDPVMVADTAKTLRWLRSQHGPGRLVLGDAFGTIDHLVALLRRAATQTAAHQPGAGLVIAARAANPFDDAELHRVAHLVRTYGTGTEIEPACIAEPADLERAVRRSRALGSDVLVVVPAGFARTCPEVDALPGVTFYGPLMSERAAAQVVHQRLTAAVHRLGHGDDGIATGLLADHGHGYAHSHGLDGEHPHPHEHPHDHPHTHARAADLVDST
ncbi:sirohydrochlorin chelatase [Georgenia faecalis]|uniref:sirohydrochlorin chelatase n=1 Tax=Georgenia faecalis TaxID=2483799 RepID=UPI000FD9CC60|nr:cobalamin biosynthesis protein CbiX [Georgenia faecalis]